MLVPNVRGGFGRLQVRLNARCGGRSSLDLSCRFGERGRPDRRWSGYPHMSDVRSQTPTRSHPPPPTCLFGIPSSSSSSRRPCDSRCHLHLVMMLAACHVCTTSFPTCCGIAYPTNRTRMKRGALAWPTTPSSLPTMTLRCCGTHHRRGSTSSAALSLALACACA